MSAPQAHSKAYWVGPEVEGVLRATALRTVIIRRGEGPIAGVLALQPAHIFLCEDFNDWVWFSKLMRKFTGPVSVGCSATPNPERFRQINASPYRSRMRVLLRYWGPSAPLDLLLPTDEITVGAPYDLMTLPACTGVRTRPSDYEVDE